ncbi:MAG: hypothetical protein VR77_07035 [Flavobacteriales bacterium BRH_c54]|nr:MAG: hypothetical protein VR77_07035 [Flavobacteriales bacterium BRH_c54]
MSKIISVLTLLLLTIFANGNNTTSYYIDYKPKDFNLLNNAYLELYHSKEKIDAYHDNYTVPLTYSEQKLIKGDDSKPISFKMDSSLRFCFFSKEGLNELFFIGFSPNFIIGNQNKRIEPILEIPLSEYKRILKKEDYLNLLKELKSIFPNVLSDSIIHNKDSQDIPILKYDFTEHSILFQFNLFGYYSGSCDYRLMQEKGVKFYENPNLKDSLTSFIKISDFFIKKIKWEDQIIVDESNKIKSIYFTNNIEFIEKVDSIYYNLISEITIRISSDFIGIRIDKIDALNDKKNTIWLYFPDFLNSIEDFEVRNGLNFTRYSMLRNQFKK